MKRAWLILVSEKEKFAYLKTEKFLITLPKFRQCDGKGAILVRGGEQYLLSFKTKETIACPKASKNSFANYMSVYLVGGWVGNSAYAMHSRSQAREKRGGTNTIHLPWPFLYRFIPIVFLI
jgi:hypothetical protein